jgi:hypothetical protein
VRECDGWAEADGRSKTAAGEALLLVGSDRDVTVGDVAWGDESAGDVAVGVWAVGAALLAVGAMGDGWPPLYGAVRDLMVKMDSAKLAQALGLGQKNEDEDGYSIDGKVLRGSRRATEPALQVVTAAGHRMRNVQDQRQAHAAEIGPVPVRRRHLRQRLLGQPGPDAVDVLAGGGFAPRLAAAVVATRADGRRVSDHRPLLREGSLIAADQRMVREVVFPTDDDGAAAGEDDPLHPGLSRRLEDVVGAHDVGLQNLCPGRAARGVRRQVDDHVLPVEVGDVGAVGGQAWYITAIEGAEGVLVLQLLAHHAADKAAHAGNENLFHGNCLSSGARGSSVSATFCFPISLPEEQKICQRASGKGVTYSAWRARIWATEKSGAS